MPKPLLHCHLPMMFAHIQRLTFSPLALLSYLLLSLALSACAPRESGTDNAQKAENLASATQPKVFKNYQKLEDLPAIQKRGEIRILAPSWEDTGLPRAGLPSHGYRELAERFAEGRNLKIQWIFVDTHEQLIQQLQDGYGDLIVAHLTQTPERKRHLAFSLPISSAHEQIIGPAGIAYDQPESLKGKRLIVGKGSSFAETLYQFSKKNPQLELDISEVKTGDPDILLDKIDAGGTDATVMDSNIASTLQEYRNDFSIGLSLTPSRPIAWAVRKRNPILLAELNEFLTESRISRSRSSRHTDDFTAITERKTLRIITRNSPASYFVWRGELMGYEYELMKKFAERKKLRLEVTVAPPGTDMIQMLKDGHGDIIAASMSITDERQQQGIKFSRPYHFIQEQLVSNQSAEALDSPTALNGRTLTIRPDTAYWATANKLLNEGYKFTLKAAAADQTTTDIISAVAAGELDATIADSHLVDIEYKFNETLVLGYKFEEQRALGWAVRNTNPELLAALDHYVKLHYRGRFFNVTYNKYFRNENRIDRYQGQRLSASDALSPYDELIKPLAAQYHFDWRILVSQMYQESKFDPKAKSFAGALGLFQVMPRTAKELGYSLPLTEETGIYAGIRYLDWTRDRFEATLPLEERLWFALAAYNAGFGHVNDARRLARQQGLNPNKWFNNVEQAMRLLSKKEHYSKARFGYVRGSEPVNYVRKIKDRYYAYLALEKST